MPALLVKPDGIDDPMFNERFGTAQDIGLQVYHAIRKALGAPDVLHPRPERTRYGAQVQNAGGYSDAFKVDINLETEIELEEGLESGLLLELACTSYRCVSSLVDLTENALVTTCFNSWEYAKLREDGFHRFRDGDWREDYKVVLDHAGQLVTGAKGTK